MFLNPPCLRNRSVRFVLASIGGAFTIIVAGLYIFVPRPPNYVEFTWQRSSLNSIVATVKSLALPPGEYAFKVDANLSPGSLRRVKNRVEMRGLDGAITLQLHKSIDGGDVIVLVTRDSGHAGMYGYVYADDTHAFENAVPDEEIEGAEPLLFLNSRCDAHWWTAYNNLL